MDNIECLPETEAQRIERIRKHLIAISWWLRGRTSASNDSMIGSDIPWGYIMALDEVIEDLGDSGTVNQVRFWAHECDKFSYACDELETERDEARDVARWLWAACRELRRELRNARNGYWNAVREYESERDKSHTAWCREVSMTRNAALEEAARVCEFHRKRALEKANKVEQDHELSLHWHAVWIEAELAADAIRALISSDDEVSDG